MAANEEHGLHIVDIRQKTFQYTCVCGWQTRPCPTTEMGEAEIRRHCEAMIQVVPKLVEFS